jgi:type II secretory pathway component PulF
MVSYKNLYARILERIRLGDSFSTSFEKIGKRSRILPISVQQLVTTGEKSGKLSDILLKIANIYDQKASETAEKLPTILEPALLLIIGGLVGGIAFAIITPIYSVVGNIG